MSKSLGNFYTLRDLLARGYTGREIRYVLLGAHYRKKLNFTMEALDQARETLKKFEALFIRLKAVAQQGDGQEVQNLIQEAQTSFKAALSDDLNIAEALAAAFGLMRESNKLLDEEKLSAAGAKEILDVFKDFDRVFAFFDVELAAEETVPEDILALAEERVIARKNRDFSRSDAIRDELSSRGYAVEDIPGGGFRIKKLG